MLLNQDLTKKSESIDSLIQFTKKEMEDVNNLIISQTTSNVFLISTITNHLIASGGKRLRPMLTLAGAKIFGYEGAEHIKLAASVEFMHTATLLHDDVVDESNLRRGKKTARTLWGNQASVLVGDYLLGQAFQIMVDTNFIPALRILSHAASIIAQGEVMQLATSNNLNTTQDDYLSVIEAKTATLFAAAAEVGPSIARASQDHCLAMRSYGLNLGLSFQLIDDALDYKGCASALGKNIGDDFREGKVTLPIIISYHRGTEKEKNFWKTTIEERKIGTESFEEALFLINQHSALEETVALAKKYVNCASSALDLLPRSFKIDILNDLLSFAIHRIH